MTTRTAERAAAYPALDHLLGAWFHQDFDIESDVPEIIPKYVASEPPETARAAIADIERFLADHAGREDAAFEHVFAPSVSPSGWGMTAAEWLTMLARRIADAQRRPG